MSSQPIRGAGRPEDGVYRLPDGRRVPSVTTIISRFKEPAGLLGWMWRCGRDGIDTKQIVNDSCEFGSAVHAGFEAMLWGDDPMVAARPIIEAHFSEDEAPDRMVNASKCLARLQQWVHKYKPEVIATEVPMVHDELLYGGTPDLLCRIDGKVCIADVKTSANTYPSYAWQIAAYGLLCEKHFGVTIDRYVVLWAGKDGKGFKAWWWGNLQSAAMYFQSLVQAHLFERGAHTDFNDRRRMEMPHPNTKVAA